LAQAAPAAFRHAFPAEERMSTVTMPEPVAVARRSNHPPIMEVEGLNLWYGHKQALIDVNFDLFPREILAFIGPSGCGKTTALKCLNRMHDEIRDLRQTGRITMHGEDVNAPDLDPPLHRRRFGWVAQRPDPFPMSIYENVAYGPRIHGLVDDTRQAMDVHVEYCLRRALLWDEVKDDLHRQMGTQLSGGQQQRLCIARALSVDPEVLLMDEPTGSIDPIATAGIEELMVRLKDQVSIVLITHSMMQARRLADRVAFFHLGRLMEIGSTDAMFSHPRSAECRRFIAGQSG
jgi:phosphate transport system ATP-binding protein